MSLQYVQNVQKVIGVIQRAQSIISFVDKLNLFFLQGFSGANTPYDFLQRLTGAFGQALGVNVSALQGFLPAVKEIFAFAGHEWGSWMTRIRNDAANIAQAAASDPQILNIIADSVKARGRVALVITLPSPPKIPGLTNNPFQIPEIPITWGSDELIIKSDPRLGRLFGIVHG